jgi:hypothetical protein
MALYTVSTSGNLTFAYTGLGTPVPTFANEGIATSAIAGSPIAGNNPKIWTIGPPNYFTSSGGLIVVDINLQTQSGLSASSIAEYPISGTLDNIPAVQTGLFKGYLNTSSGNLITTGSSTEFFIPGRLDSSGNLVISGSTSVNKIARLTTSGNLLISGNTVYSKTLDFVTSGNLIITTEWYSGTLQSGGIADYPISAAAISAGETSAIGQVHTTVVSFYGNINSSGNLVFTQPGQVTQSLGNSGVLAGSPISTQTLGGGTDTIAVGLTYNVVHNETTAGNLLLISSSGFGYTYTSAGNLVLVTSDTYNSTLTRSTAGSLVMSGTDVEEDLWEEDSNGLLTITPYGGYTYPLSDTSPIAGAALADQTIGGGMDTTPIQTVPSAILNRSSEGSLLISGNTVFNKTIDFPSSGNLIIFGATNQGQKYLVQSSGNDIISGTTVQSSTVQRQTSGNLVFVDMDGYNTVSLSDSSGIAGAPVADLPLGGGIDVYRGFRYNHVYGEQTSGNLVLTGTDTPSKTLDFVSHGNLLLTTSDSFNHTYATPTRGNLDISGNTVTVRTLDFLSAGNLIVVEYDLSTQSGLAASAIGEFPIGGTMDNIPQIEVQFVHGSPSYTSSGNLIIVASDTTQFSVEEKSAGNLVISGTDSAHRSWIRTSNGELLLSGNITQSSLRKELSSGNIDIIGNTRVNTLHPRQSSGNLVLTGTDSEKDIYKESSVGNLLISGNITQSSLRKELSSGNLIVVDQSVNALYSGGIADLPIATGPLAGGEINAITQQVQVSFYSNNYHSSGNLVFTQPGGIVQELGNTSPIAGAALAEQPIAGGMDTLYVGSTFQDLLNESTSGNIVISGTSGYGYTYTSSGNLIISGTDAYRSIANIQTHGNLILSGVDSGNIYIEEDSAGSLLFTPVGWKSTATISGTIAGSPLASTPIGGDEMENNVAVVQVSYISGGTYYPGNVAYTTSAGNLKIFGIDHNVFGEQSAGNLVITGTDTIEAIIHSTITSTGNLIVTGSTVDSTTITVNSAGELLISGTDTTAYAFGNRSAGNLTITGTDSTSYAIAKTSAGNLIITGTDQVSTTTTRESAGSLVISGTTTSEFIPAGSIRSSGELTISGTATAVFIPGKQAPAIGGGGSYIFPSSWDILTPYFPDDRHILGYQEATTEPGNLRVNGFTSVTFISNPQPARKSLSDYMREVPAKQAAIKPTPVLVDPAEEQRKKLMQLAILEDQLLLNGRLLDFDPIQDELDNELNM